MIADKSLVTTKLHNGNIIWSTLLHFCICHCRSFSIVDFRENYNFTCRKKFKQKISCLQCKIVSQNTCLFTRHHRRLSFLLNEHSNSNHIFTLGHPDSSKYQILVYMFTLQEILRPFRRIGQLQILSWESYKFWTWFINWLNAI
jgi:hypothetical protein